MSNFSQITGTEHNFDMYESNLVSNLDVEYDYVSCLHYGPYAFSANGEATIVALKVYYRLLSDSISLIFCQDKPCIAKFFVSSVICFLNFNHKYKYVLNIKNSILRMCSMCFKVSKSFSYTIIFCV